MTENNLAENGTDEKITDGKDEIKKDDLGDVTEARRSEIGNADVTATTEEVGDVVPDNSELDQTNGSQKTVVISDVVEGGKFDVDSSSDTMNKTSVARKPEIGTQPGTASEMEEMTQDLSEAEVEEQYVAQLDVIDEPSEVEETKETDVSEILIGEPLEVEETKETDVSKRLSSSEVGNILPAKLDDIESEPDSNLVNLRSDVHFKDFFSSEMISEKGLQSSLQSEIEGGKNSSPEVIGKKNEQFNSSFTAESAHKLSQNLRISSSVTFGTDEISMLENYVIETHEVVFQQLSAFEKQSIVAILTKVFKQLKVLQRCLPYPMFDWKRVCVNGEQYIHKIMSESPEKIFPDYYEYENGLLWKMQVDLYEISSVIFYCIKEISLKDSYSELIHFLEDSNFVKFQENIVLQENGFLWKLAHAFRRKFLRKEAEYNRADYVETEFTSQEEEIFDTKVWMQIEKRYIDSWEKARRIQNWMKIEKEENILTRTLAELSRKQQFDGRVSSEIETYLTMEIKGLEEKVAAWTESYNTEIEQRDIELTQMNAEKDSIDNRMKTLLITFNEREEKLVEIRAFFAEKEREEEIKFQRNKGATIIQKWWRKYLKIKRKFLYEQKMAKKLAQQKKAEAKAAAAKAAKKKA